MKILLISPEDTKGNNWGGVSTYTTLLADYLGRIHQEVYVLTPGSKNEKFAQQHYTHIRLQRQKKSRKHVVWKMIGRVLRRLFPILMTRIYWAVEVLHYVDTYGPFDIVEAPDSRGWYTFWPKMHIPLILRANGSNLYFSQILNSKLSRLTSFMERKWVI